MSSCQGVQRRSGPYRILRAAFLSIWSFGIAIVATNAFAQSSATTQPAIAENEITLADRQALIKDRVSRLEDRMYQLSQAIKKSEPEKSARLLEGLSHLRGEQVRERMEQIIERIREQQLADAGELQGSVIDDLQALLKELVEDPDQLEERKSEIERLEAVRKALEELVKEQERERDEAEQMRAAERRAEALDAAAAKVKNLLERQRAATEQTRQAGDLSSNAKDQAEIRGETEAVARDVTSLADAADMAGSKPSGEGEESPPSPNEEDDGSNGEESPPREGDTARKAAESLKSAGDSMKNAEDALRDGERQGAQEKQEEAVKELEKSLKSLEDEAKSLRNKLKLEELSEEQRETAEKTRKLGKEMGDASKDGKQGDSSEGEPSGDESSEGSESSEGESGEKSPGQKSVEKAAPHQDSAADELKEGKTDKAIEEQEKALEELKKAKEELEDRLDQLRKEQQEEFLAALESRFKGMLARQLECNKVTDRLAEVGAANWKRSDQLELADLSQKQRWVGDQADEALFLLTEDGTTVILPQLVTQVRDDARDVADRLAAADAGDGVRATQADLELVLRDIIDAIEQKQEEMQKNDEGGGGGGDGSQPLLPGSAELKLLRSCQLRVNAATERLRTDRENPAAVADEIQTRLKKLSQRQAEVSDMAREMHEALQRAQ